MHVRDLPDRSQDYLKAIWDIAEYSGHPAPLGEIAARVNQNKSTASEAIKRLAKQGVVNHEPYAGVTLTDQGRELAVEVVRRHRIVETFLVTELGYTWDEVHEDADLLEHGVSDRLLARLDAHLGYPARDPHGDPIPRSTDQGHLPELTPLSEVAPGSTVTITQVDDQDPELLRYLADHELVPGATITVPEAASAGLLTVVTDTGHSVPVAESALGAIRVKP